VDSTTGARHRLLVISIEIPHRTVGGCHLRCATASFASRQSTDAELPPNERAHGVNSDVTQHSGLVYVLPACLLDNGRRVSHALNNKSLVPRVETYPRVIPPGQR
jgi:hypothetical protein